MKDYKEYIDKKFGKLTVIGVDVNKPYYLLCKCECGELRSVYLSNLRGNVRNKPTESCGKCFSIRKSCVGERRGMLLVLSEYRIVIGKQRKIMVHCICDCGNEFDFLRASPNTSCGCANTYYKDKDKHKGISSSYSAMMARCYNEDHDNYKNYGAKGVYVCPRWHIFKNFYHDLHSSWKKGLTIDRFPVSNGNYVPNNVRWATWQQQVENRITTKLSKEDVINIRNSGLSDYELSKHYNVQQNTINRVKNRKRWKNISE